MKTYADIVTRARQLHSAGAVPTREWTLSLICDHLAKAMTGSTGALGPGTATNPTPLYRRLAGRVVVLTFGFIPKGVPSPKRVLPEAQISWDDAIRNLENAIARCEHKAQTREPWLLHPLIGFSDARNWRRFHLVHARHHFGCLRIPAKPSPVGITS